MDPSAALEHRSAVGGVRSSALELAPRLVGLLSGLVLMRHLQELDCEVRTSLACLASRRLCSVAASGTCRPGLHACVLCMLACVPFMPFMHVVHATRAVHVVLVELVELGELVGLSPAVGCASLIALHWPSERCAGRWVSLLSCNRAYALYLFHSCGVASAPAVLHVSPFAPHWPF